MLISEFLAAMFSKLERKDAEVAASVPAGRFAVPADFAGMAVFLGSAESDYIVSKTYNVDGGQWMN